MQMRQVVCAVTVALAGATWTARLGAQEDVGSSADDRATRLSRQRSRVPALRASAPAESPRRRITPDERGPSVPLEPTGESKAPAEPLAAAVACDTNQYAVLSGSALFQYIQDAGPSCANQMFAGNATTFAAFAKTKMISVGNATAGRAASYNGTDPGNGLEALYLWLRAGYFVAFYYPANVPWYNASTSTFDAQVVASSRGAINALVNSGHFYDNSDANGRVIADAITLMDSSNSQAYYLGVVKEWLSRWNQSYAASWYMRNGVNAIFTVLFRGHWRDDYVAAIANDSVLVSRLSAFVDKTWMLDTDAEFMIGNAARELTRYLQYSSAPIYPAVKAKTQAILAQYTLLHPLYLIAATNASYYDDCNTYDVCGFEREVEAQVLTRSHTCSATYKLRAQALTTGQFLETCPKLTTQAAYFHQKLATGQQPIAGDLNNDLEVVVFDSSDDYQTYAGVIFGIDTNNGGMYLEGDPRAPDNEARFICYRAEWAPEFEIWNLNHEAVHYLDGRFDMNGGFSDYATDSGKTVWWIEGLAEYVSKKDHNDTAVAAARTRAYDLSTIFSNNYASGTERVYTWGYLATRFMFERRRADVNTILGYFRPGSYAAYLSWLNARLSAYDAEFRSWCGTVESVPDDVTPPMASLTAPTAGATVAGVVTLAATATDDHGVSRVEFLVDGAAVGSDTSAPYSVSWSSTTVANGSHTLRARAYDAAGNAGTSDAVGVTVSNGTAPRSLSNGVPVGASGAAGSQTVYYIDVPSGSTNLVIATSGGTGDLDLYTRFGSPPTLTTYACRPYASNNNETCTVAAPAAGRYYAMLHGYTAYAGASLRASFTPPATTTVRVISPNGGESWTRGSTRTISWTTTSSQRVDVALYKDTTFVQWITWYVPSSPGSYNWTIPGSLTPGSDYKITILDYNQRHISDSSDASFSIN